MHVFVSLPVEEAFDSVFETVSKIVTLRGLQVIRADRRGDAPVSPDRTAVNQDIRDSRFIVADLTGNNPHVLQDVHRANEVGKPWILLSQEAPDQAPLQVQGATIYQYDPTDLDSLQTILLRLAAEPSSPHKSRFDDTMSHGSLTARIGLMDIATGQQKNPFVDFGEHQLDPLVSGPEEIV